LAVSLGMPELARLTCAIDDVSLITDPADFPAAAVAAAFTLVPCEVASYNEVLENGETHAFWHPEAAMDLGVATSALERYVHEHPLVMEIIRTGDGSPRAISDFLSDAEFRQLNLYRLLFGPMGLADQLAIGLPAPRPLIIGIALNRERRGFSDTDRQLIGLLRPYLVQAHRSAHLSARVQAAAAVGLPSRLGFLVQAGGRVESLTGTVPEWVPMGDLFPAGMLDAEAWRWFSQQRAGGGDLRGRQARARAGELPPLTRPLTRVTGEQRWHFRRVEMTVGPVLVLSRGTEDPERPRAVYQSMGLTEREAGILQLLTRGRSNPAIAEELGIARATVKRHIEAIYRKLGVHNRTQAAALATDTVAHEQGGIPTRVTRVKST